MDHGKAGSLEPAFCIGPSVAQPILGTAKCFKPYVIMANPKQMKAIKNGDDCRTKAAALRSSLSDGYSPELIAVFMEIAARWDELAVEFDAIDR